MNTLFLDTAHDVIRQELEAAGYKCEQWDGTTSLLSIAGNYEGFIVRSKVKIDREILDAAVKLKFIGRVGAGLENIDVDYARANGIKVYNSPEGNRDAVGEHALGMLLALMNNLLIADDEVRRGIWLREANRGSEIKGKTVGIIGHGNMGSAFAQRLQGFDCRVIAYDKYKTGFGNEKVEEVDYDTIFRETDILSLHVPLTEETRMLVNSDYLSRFKKPIWLINTARGPVVDTAALLSAIDNGQVKGAALDVLEFEKFSFEKLDFDQLPEIFKKLVQSNKVILSPHIAGWSHESKYKLGKVLVDKIVKEFG